MTNTTITISTLKKVSGIFEASKPTEFIPDRYFATDKKFGIPEGSVVIYNTEFKSNFALACKFLIYSDLRSLVGSYSDKINSENEKDEPNTSRIAYFEASRDNLREAMKLLPYTDNDGYFSEDVSNMPKLYQALAFSATGSKSYGIKNAMDFIKSVTDSGLDTKSIRTTKKVIEDFVNQSISFKDCTETKNVKASLNDEKTVAIVKTAQATKKAWGKSGIKTSQPTAYAIYQQILLTVFEIVFKLSAPEKAGKKERSYVWEV